MATPETFNQFYARVFAYRKAELRRITDPVKRAALKKWHARNKKELRAAWEAGKFAPAHSLSEETLEKIRAEHPRMERTVSTDNGSYRVINGEAA